jgi:hypothetical protein
MRGLTWRAGGRWLGSRLHWLAAVSLVLAAGLGQPVAASEGWVAYPPRVIALPVFQRPGEPRWGRLLGGLQLRAGWAYWRQASSRAVLRSLVLGGLWWGGSQQEPLGVVLLPWVEWLLAGLAVAWPGFGQQPEVRGLRWGLGWLRRGSLLWLGADVLQQGLTTGWSSGWLRAGGRGVGLGGVVTADRPRVAITRAASGYQVHLQGEFWLTVPAEDALRRRQAILFLRQLEGPTARQGSRATRDGRRPLITQQQLAAGLGVTQPEISRWEGYWQQRDWANLLSLQTPEVLTAEMRAQVVDVCAQFPWWGHERVWAHLQAQGVAVTQSQVRQAAQDSGWPQLKATLSRFFVVGPECVRPRDEALTSALLAQVQTLLTKLEAGERLTAEEHLDLAHLQTLCAEVGVPPRPAPPAVPWAQKVHWLLFAAETPAGAGEEIRCTYCGHPAERRKGQQPRRKRYQDDQGQWQTVAVYRYRCDNPACPYGSFTHFPAGLLPHSPYRLELRLTALQMYAWGRSTYRRTAQAVGVKSGRVYQWVSACGQELLPVAALFGVVKSSGVVGVDEKWVQVPAKAPRGRGRTQPPQPRHWMYVYFAVDVYTYDLLHIAIYAHNTAASTRAFLLALRAKGYHPRVIVTDLRPEYGPAIQTVFPQAQHHECLFHALQWVHRQLKDIYGRQYVQTQPEVVQLKDQIDALLQAQTRRTAEKRYAQVVALREEYVAATPAVASVFDTLERHWPTLVNGIESTLIPRTNNTAELVIRRFAQHYQNFCGFDSLESARLFLAVFEKVYRFTPFTADAQPRIRGKCPLELAGYDIAKLPMTHICRGWALDWPTGSAQEVVPNA